jgi:hypothetical protein
VLERTTGRGCELMGSSYAMLDMTVYGRQEAWEDSPEGLAATVLQHHVRADAHRRRRPRREPTRRAAHLAVVAAGRRPPRRPRHRRCHPDGPRPLSSVSGTLTSAPTMPALSSKFPAGYQSVFAGRRADPLSGRFHHRVTPGPGERAVQANLRSARYPGSANSYACSGGACRCSPRRSSRSDWRHRDSRSGGRPGPSGLS